MSSAQWFYRTGDAECGPVTIDELRFLVQSGKIPRTNLVRSTDAPRWVSLQETKVLAASGPALERRTGTCAPPAQFQIQSIVRSHIAVTPSASTDQDSEPQSFPENIPATDDNRKTVVGVVLGLLTLLLLIWFLWPQADGPTGSAGSGGSGSGTIGTEQASGDGSSETAVAASSPITSTEAVSNYIATTGESAIGEWLIVPEASRANH